MTSLSAINTLSSSAMTRHANTKFGNATVSTVAKEAAKDTLTITTRFLPSMLATWLSAETLGFIHAGAGSFIGTVTHSFPLGMAAGYAATLTLGTLAYKAIANLCLKVPK